jgi:hypothetical protein
MKSGQGKEGKKGKEIQGKSLSLWPQHLLQEGRKAMPSN